MQDGVGRMKERPQDDERQKLYYSGKKTHTEKNLIIGEIETRQIVYLSRMIEGKKHERENS